MKKWLSQILIFSLIMQQFSPAIAMRKNTGLEKEKEESPSSSAFSSQASFSTSNSTPDASPYSSMIGSLNSDPHTASKAFANSDLNANIHPIPSTPSGEYRSLRDLTRGQSEKNLTQTAQMQLQTSTSTSSSASIDKAIIKALEDVKRKVLSNTAFVDNFNKTLTITQLNLSNANIGADEGYVFGWFPSASKEISALANALKTNTALTHLDLSHNKIGPEGAKALAESLLENPDLLDLTLMLNNIGTEGANAFAEALLINRSLAYLKLKLKLNLNFNCNDIGIGGIKTIAAGLETNQNLTKLHLTDNKIDTEGAIALAHVLSNNKFLVHLTLNNNCIGDEGVQQISNALLENNTLATLELQNNNISPNGANAFSNTLLKNHTVTALDLTGNNIDAILNSYIQRLIDVNKQGLKKNTLTELNFKNFNLQNAGVSKVIGLFSSSSTLTSLDLQGNNIDDDGLQIIASNLDKVKLLNLNLMNNKISSKEGEIFSQLLSANTTLTHLNLSRNALLADGVQKLFQGLSKNKTVALLDIQDVNINFDTTYANVIKNCDSAVCFAQSLSANKTLTHLNLRNNCLSLIQLKKYKTLTPDQYLKTFENSEYFVPYKIFSSALEEYNRSLSTIFQTLHYLSLYNTDLGDTGVEMLFFQDLGENNALTVLDLQCNKITLDGIKAIAKNFNKYKSLAELLLGSNNIGNDGAKVFAECLSKNNTLTRLDLDANNIATDGVKALISNLKENSTLTQLNLRYNMLNENDEMDLRSLQQLKATPTPKRNFLKSKTHTQSWIKINYEYSNFVDFRKSSYPAYNTLDDTHRSLQKVMSKNLSVVDFIETFNNNSALLSLEIKNSKINSTEATLLFHALATNKSLTHLDLSNNPTIFYNDNSFCQNIVKTFDDALSTNTTLTQLDLSADCIGPEAANMIAKALEKNHSLRELNLSNNRLGGKGITVLSDSLKNNNTLTTVNLSNNSIDDDGRRTLEGLKRNRPSLDLKY